MKISEVIERLKSLCEVAGDVEVVISDYQEHFDDRTYYEAACFEIRNVTFVGDWWTAFEKDNKDQVVSVF